MIRRLATLARALARALYTLTPWACAARRRALQLRLRDAMQAVDDELAAIGSRADSLGATPHVTIVPRLPQRAKRNRWPFVAGE